MLFSFQGNILYRVMVSEGAALPSNVRLHFKDDEQQNWNSVQLSQSNSNPDLWYIEHRRHRFYYYSIMRNIKDMEREQSEEFVRNSMALEYPITNDIFGCNCPKNELYIWGLVKYACISIQKINPDILPEETIIHLDMISKLFKELRPVDQDECTIQLIRMANKKDFTPQQQLFLTEILDNSLSRGIFIHHREFDGSLAKCLREIILVCGRNLLLASNGMRLYVACYETENKIKPSLCQFIKETIGVLSTNDIKSLIPSTYLRSDADDEEIRMTVEIMLGHKDLNTGSHWHILRECVR